MLKGSMNDFNSTLSKILGDRIRKERVNLGLNQEDVAKAVGLGRTTITNIEIGRHQVPLAVLYKIANTLNFEVHSILPTFEDVENNMKESNSDEDEALNLLLKGKDFDDKTLISIKDIFKNL